MPDEITYLTWLLALLAGWVVHKLTHRHHPRHRYGRNHR